MSFFPRFLLPVLPLLLLHPAVGQVTITNVTVNNVTIAAPVTRNGIDGVDTNDFYNVTYNGVETQLTSLTAGGITYAPTQVGSAQVKRNTGTTTFPTVNPNQSTVWNNLVSVSGTAPTFNHTVAGTYINNMDALFTSRNVAAGTENLFVNSNPGSNTNVTNNIERVDFVFSTGVVASINTGFAILERGNRGGGANGGFRIAAITAVSGGVATAFGDSILIAENSYSNGGNGITNLPPINYDVTRFNTPSGPELDAMNNANIGPQGLAGVLIQTTSLVSAGTTVFGYALLGEDGPVAGAQVADFASYSTTSTFTNDVDLVTTGAVLYTAVPEPSTVALLGLSALGFVTFLRQKNRRS